MGKLVKKITIVVFFMQCVSAFAAENKNLILQVNLDKASMVSLDKKEQEYVNSALSAFVGDVTMVPEINVRTENVDAVLRDIQRKSQLEASEGLGSEDAAYASDKQTKAKLLLSLSMKKTADEKYKLTCTVSEIETMVTVATLTSAKLTLDETNEEGIDKLAYDTLISLQNKKYISPVSYDIENQLLHKENTVENYQKYIDNYTAQLESANKELEALHQQNESETEKLEADSKERTLRLKIEMMEKKKLQAEADLRQQQAEAAAEDKRQKEMAEWDKQQKDAFLQKIAQLEAKKEEIRKTTLKGISLKARINLIETDRQNIAYINSQLEQSVVESNAFYDKKCEEEVSLKENEPWKKADLTQGKPTTLAQQFRNEEVAKIRSKYDAKKKSAEKKLRDSMKADLESYKAQLNDNMNELTKTTYVFRSIDATDDFLQLSVDDYDGNKGSWQVHSTLSMKQIPKLDFGTLTLPDSEITYQTMTGKKPVTNIDAEGGAAAYEEYRDLVDQADSYFRTSVPYLYSEIALEVAYDEQSQKYVTAIQYFAIHKTEDRSELYRADSAELERLKRVQTNAAEQKEKQNQAALEHQQKQDEATAKKREKEEAKKRAAEERSKAQLGRDGIFLDLGFYKGSTDIDLLVSAGGKHFFLGFEGACVSYTDYYSDVSLLGCGIFGGVAGTLGIVRPYALCGVGLYTEDLNGYQTYSNGNSDLTPTGAYTMFTAGVDFKLNSFVLGCYWKSRTFSLVNKMDTYGITVGIGL